MAHTISLACWFVLTLYFFLRIVLGVAQRYLVEWYYLLCFSLSLTLFLWEKGFFK